MDVQSRRPLTVGERVTEDGVAVLIDTGLVRQAYPQHSIVAKQIFGLGDRRK
jgi:hypothetical protein